MQFLLQGFHLLQILLVKLVEFHLVIDLASTLTIQIEIEFEICYRADNSSFIL